MHGKRGKNNGHRFGSLGGHRTDPWVDHEVCSVCRGTKTKNTQELFFCLSPLFYRLRYLYDRWASGNCVGRCLCRYRSHARGTSILPPTNLRLKFQRGIPLQLVGGHGRQHGGGYFHLWRYLLERDFSLIQGLGADK